MMKKCNNTENKTYGYVTTNGNNSHDAVTTFAKKIILMIIKMISVSHHTRLLLKMYGHGMFHDTTIYA